MTPTATDLRAEAVGLVRHVAEAIYDADNAGRSHRDAPAFLFCPRDTIEHYLHMAASARDVYERHTEHRLDWIMAVETMAREARAAHEAMCAQLTALFSIIIGHMRGEPGDDDEVDVCTSVKIALGQLADLVGFDHAGWFDLPVEPAP